MNKSNKEFFWGIWFWVILGVGIPLVIALIIILTNFKTPKKWCWRWTQNPWMKSTEYVSHGIGKYALFRHFQCDRKSITSTKKGT